MINAKNAEFCSTRIFLLPAQYLFLTDFKMYRTLQKEIMSYYSNLCLVPKYSNYIAMDINGITFGSFCVTYTKVEFNEE